MKKTRYSETQILNALKEFEGVRTAGGICLEEEVFKHGQRTSESLQEEDLFRIFPLNALILHTEEMKRARFIFLKIDYRRERWPNPDTRIITKLIPRSFKSSFSH